MSKSAFLLALTVDKALGAAGCGLAVASLGFGVYMNVHGPVDSFGKSKDFTVFAQLAPKRPWAQPTHGEPSKPSEESLDMTATASIPKPSAESRRVQENAVIPSMTLEAASADRATISIDGRPETVRVGDLIPGAGEVLEIRLGRRPVVKTSRGLILSSRQD